jgi:hypothetical protein
VVTRVVSNEGKDSGDKDGRHTRTAGQQRPIDEGFEPGD